MMTEYDLIRIGDEKFIDGRPRYLLQKLCS
jgi:hypothetical protein